MIATLDPPRRIDHVTSSRWKGVAGVAAVFISVSFLAAPIPGINEPHYLCKARAAFQPDWCARDFFLHSANAHAVFFAVTGPLTSVLSFEAVAALGRFTSLIVLAVGWQRLACAIELSPRGQFVSACGFALMSQLGDFSGEWLLGGFESKVPAWGITLFAIGLWIDRADDHRLSSQFVPGMFCGLATALHPVVGGWGAICVVMSMAASLITATLRFKSRLAHLAMFSCGTVIAGLPGLIPAFKLLMDDSLPIGDRQTASFVQVFWRLQHHLDPTQLRLVQWLFAGTLLTIIVVASWLIIRCGEVHRDRSRSAFLMLLHVFGAATLIAVIGIVAGWHQLPAEKMTDWQWRAALLKFYPFRTFDALLPILCSLTMTLALSKRVPARRDKLSVSTLPSTETVSHEIITDTESRLQHARRLPIFQSTFILVFAAALPILIAAPRLFTPPPGYSRQQFSDWKQACAWINSNTPRDAMFLTPRESCGFKWFAERAEYVCYKDCPQDAKGILTWNTRLWDLYHWTLASSTGDNLYTDSDLAAIRAKTGCEFLVTRDLGPFERPPIAQFGEWQILDLSLKR